MRDELVLMRETRATFCNQSKSLPPLHSLLVTVAAAGVDATKVLASKSIERKRTRTDGNTGERLHRLLDEIAFIVCDKIVAFTELIVKIINTSHGAS